MKAILVMEAKSEDWLPVWLFCLLNLGLHCQDLAISRKWHTPAMTEVLGADMKAKYGQWSISFLRNKYPYNNQLERRGLMINLDKK